MSKSRFNKNNARKYVVVHRPHDDPNFYNDDASQHILVSVDMHNRKKECMLDNNRYKQVSSLKQPNENMGEALLYGINFQDSDYDYTQHLKPIGSDPINSVFIPSSKALESSKKSIDDLFIDSDYQDSNKKQAKPVFFRGVAKPEYLEKMQDIPDKLRGFDPDINPSLREVLEALEDEAYVVNNDVISQNKFLEDSDDDLFEELLQSGEVKDDAEFGDKNDKWDIDNLEGCEKMAQFNYDKSDCQSDIALSGQEEEDKLGDISSFPKNLNNKPKELREKGSMPDISGFSMSSSVVARTEPMIILDQQYDQIIREYENYEEEQENDEKNCEPFDMSRERPDFENLVDDFLENYELERGARALAKKDPEIQKLKDAADEVGRGKLSMRRKKERSKQNNANKLSESLQKLSF